MKVTITKDEAFNLLHYLSQAQQFVDYVDEYYSNIPVSAYGVSSLISSILTNLTILPFESEV